MERASAESFSVVPNEGRRVVRHPRPSLLLLILLQIQRRRVDAVAQSGRRRAVGEDVAEVGAAVVAGDFGAQHAEAAVDVLVDQFFVVRRVKTRPAAARIELGLGAEKRGTAADAAVGAVAVGIPIFASEGGLGAFFAGDAVFGRGQLGTPLGVGFLDFRHGCSRQVRSAKTGSFG